METWSWWRSPGWPWWRAADAAARCVGAAFVVHRWLAPWTLWTLRRAACWTRWALWRDDAAVDARPRPSTCACCGGVDFDGMVGRWAVVTGCTDGIGKEYALQLAERGMNIALISRTLSKLQAVAEEINGRHGDGVRTRIVVADFTSRGGTASLTDAFDGVRRGLDGLDVAVLVNNAGTCYARPDRLLDLPPCCSSAPSAEGDPIRDVIECNVLGAVAMCRIVMPLMMAARGGNGGGGGGGPEERDGPDGVGDGGNGETRPSTVGGVVVNVSSATALMPCPMLSVYGATKAFLHKFSAELAAEYADQPSVGGAARRSWLRHRRRTPPRVAVRCLNTGFVATKMSRVRPATTGVTWIPGPGQYARHSLRALACHCGCRRLRNGRGARARGETGPTAGDGRRDGWLATAASVVLDSPTSPFAAVRGSIATTGFIMHTIMVHLSNVAVLMFGEEFVSKSISQILTVGRDRIARRDAEKMKQNNAARHRGSRPDTPKCTNPSTADNN